MIISVRRKHGDLLSVVINVGGDAVLDLLGLVIDERGYQLIVPVVYLHIRRAVIEPVFILFRTVYDHVSAERIEPEHAQFRVMSDA